MFAILFIILGAVLLSNPTPGSQDTFWGIIWLIVGLVLFFDD